MHKLRAIKTENHLIRC